MNELKERKELDSRFMWDLTPLYENDEAFYAALPDIKPLLARCETYKGKLTDKASILSFFRDETELDLLLSDLFCYASLRRSEDTRAEEAQAMYAKIYSVYVEAASKIAFADPEIVSLPEETLRSLMEDPELADYRYRLLKLSRLKPHTLSSPEETLLASFGEVFAAPKLIAENLEDADLTFRSVKDKDGNEHEVTGSNYILLQSDPDRVLRKNAFESFYEGYKGHIHTFAAAYAGAVRYAAASASARHYSSSREMSMASEAVPSAVYDNLISSVRGHMDTMYRYADLRKKLLGIDELHYYDLYAPLVGESTKRYTFGEAQQMVLDTVSVFGEDYLPFVQEAFEKRWVDVYPNKGKAGGAYSSGTYRSNPYILMNFTGTLDSVSTLAHEMGHSMHTLFSNRHQQPQNADYTLFVAEVASTVNENLLVERLLATAQDPKEKLIYLNQYLEAFKGTVYRQTMFAEFEKKAHETAERGEALTPAVLSGIYSGLISDYFGPALIKDEEVQYEWARIPHFYRPFYVYKYATSYSAAAAISEMIRTEGEPAIRRYLDFLSLGGSMDPLDELKIAGVDLTTSSPIDLALRKFEKVVEEAENCAKALA